MQPNFRTILTSLAIALVAFVPVVDDCDWEEQAPRHSEFSWVTHVDPPSSGVMPTRSAFSFAGRRVEIGEHEAVLSVLHCQTTSFAALAPCGACVEQIEIGLSQGQQSFLVLRLTV